MNTSSTLRTLPKVLALLVALGCTLPLVHAKVGEQENWYLAKEIKLENSVPSYAKYWKDPQSGTEYLIGAKYQENGGYGISRMDFSGNHELFPFLGDNRGFQDLAVLNDGSILALYTDSQNYSDRTYHIAYGGVNNSYQFLELAEDIAEVDAGGDTIRIDDSGRIFIAKTLREEDENLNYKTLYTIIKEYSLDTKNPTQPTLSLVNSFKIYPGEAPGELPGVYNWELFSDDRMVIYSNVNNSGRYLNFFTKSGEFIKRVNVSYVDSLYTRNDQVITRGNYGREIFFRNKTGDVLQRLNLYGAFDKQEKRWWLLGWPMQNRIIGYNIDQNNVYRIQILERAYRTKGLPTPNVIPQPVVRSVAQRPGTNILDIDFEIIDPDDDTATAGILATVAQESQQNQYWDEWNTFENPEFNDLNKLIIPTALDEGTENKIGQPIATNQVHRVSWYVRGDWDELSGNLKIGVLCRDARRTKPVDLHFLELPLDEGTLTISRSPLKDSDMLNYYQFVLATQAGGITLEYGKIKKADGTILVDYDINQSPRQKVTRAGRDYFMDALGYRWASIAELSVAREAATPGSVNQWEATNRVIPRNLPSRVNEYGFDVGNHGTRAWWVVKESSISIPEFSSVSFDQDGSEDDQFGNRLAISDNKLVIGQSNNNDDSLQFFETDANGQTINPLGVIKPTDNESQLYQGFGRQGDFKIEGNLLAVGTPDAYASDPNNQDQVNWDSWNTGAVYLFNLDGNPPTQVQRLQASDGTQNDYFGYSVDLDSNLLVVGAYGDDQDGLQNSGSAYVFKRGTNGQYAEIAKLLPEESQADAQFGHTVAVADQVIAIGAPNQDMTVNGNNFHNVGSVLLFKEDGSGNVSFTQEIQAPNPRNDSYIYFGNSISVDGSKMIVGAYQVSTSTTYEQGAAYLYLIQSDGTAQLAASIFSPNPREYGKFGSSVSIEEDRLLISAPYEDSDNGSQSGVVYVYKVTSDGKVTLQERLTHPTGKANDEFGRSIGLAGQNILVGAPGYDLSNDRWNGGGAVLFRSSQ